MFLLQILKRATVDNGSIRSARWLAISANLKYINRFVT
jgi:hypothetical protein